MSHLTDLTLAQLTDGTERRCACGKVHRVKLDALHIEPGAIRHIPEALKKMGASRPFVVCDRNTMAAAWEPVRQLLEANGIAYSFFCFDDEQIEPDEHACGTLLMAFDPVCDSVMGIGSGVINDCCKVLCRAVGKKQMIVATAPSMDGYASNSAAMIRGRVKVSIYVDPPAAVICDTDILKNAPDRMLQAGLGDMLAKYISVFEWELSHLITGEYYCKEVAGLTRKSLMRVRDNAHRLKDRDPEAVQAIAEGLVLSGLASGYAGVSRPASGTEHCFSHIWEMMNLDRGTPYELHGIQVGVGTLIMLKLFDTLKDWQPEKETAERFIRDFSDAEWEQRVRDIFGKAADAIIRQEHENDRKNDRAAHAERLRHILENSGAIREMMRCELPSAAEIEALMKEQGLPCAPQEIGVSREDTVKAFLGSREVRSRYMTSSMLWDSGVLYTVKVPE